MAEKKPLLVIITGLSGAGRSVAIKALEDLGFYCMDNLPMELFDAALGFIKNHEGSRYAVGTDIRDENFVKEFAKFKDKISKQVRCEVLFLTASEDALVNRYQTTRRKHPLIDVGGQLSAAILREKSLLSKIEAQADVVFDTSSWSPHFLMRSVERHFSKDHPGRSLYVNITSFGFKHGIYRNADSIYDVRFLDNPYFVQELKEKTGLNPQVRDFVFNDQRTQVFIDKLLDMHTFLLPQYYNEGKHYFRIGIGCTGGKHRSVAIAEELAAKITNLNLPHVLVSVSHRDIEGIGDK